MYLDTDTIHVTNNQQFLEAIQSHGPMLTPGIACLRAGVVRQRIYELISQGRFRRFYIFGQLHICEAEFCDWLSKRKETCA